MTGTLHGGRMIRSSGKNQTETINALPIGAVTAWMGNEIPKDFLGFKEVSYPVNRAIYPEFVAAVWCGEAYNADADFFYRTADEAGSIRSDTGDWLWMPVGDLYFMRGRDASGTKHPYQYEDWAIENITGNLGIQSNGANVMDIYGGAIRLAGNKTKNTSNTPTDSASGPYPQLDFDASFVVKTSTETRPMNFPVKWIIRAANSSASQNGVDVVALKAKVDGLETQVEGIENGQGAPVGSVVSFAGREDALPPGWMALGSTLQSLPVSHYPGFTNKVWCGPDYNDDADFFYRCDHTDGTGRNVSGQYITLPVGDLYFLRGRESSDTKHPYKYQQDAVKDFIVNLTSPTGDLSTINVYGNGSALNQVPVQFLNVGSGGDLSTDASKLLPFNRDGTKFSSGNDETRPMNFPVKWIIKLFDGVTNPDMLDIQELIETANNNSVPLGTIMESGGTEADPGYIRCIDSMQYYPISQAPDLFNKVWVGEAANDTAEYFFRCSSDGIRNLEGTHFTIPSDVQVRKSGNPFTIIDVGTIGANQRFSIPNPFPGYRVSCEVQAIYDGNTGYLGSPMSQFTGSYNICYGADANQLSDGDIVFQSSEHGTWTKSNISDNPFGYTASSTAKADCRVVITRLNKLDAPLTCYQIKAWGAAVNQGLADFTKLMDEIASLRTQLPVSTIIYPNGGTKEIPANVTTNQRISMENPYPGHYVQCEAQVQLEGKWGQTEWRYIPGTGTYGVKASQLLPDDTVILQSGNKGIISGSANTGNPFGNTNEIASAPARVIVTCLGKIQ